MKRTRRAVVDAAAKAMSKESTGAASASVSAAGSPAVSASGVSSTPVLPTSVAEYRQRLVTQSKELKWKDPPNLPPGAIEVTTPIYTALSDAVASSSSSSSSAEGGSKKKKVKRSEDSEAAEAATASSSSTSTTTTSNLVKPRKSKNGSYKFTDFPNFTPNRSPEDVLRAGAFGGTYFRPITSAVTNLSYRSKDVLSDTVEPSWIQGLDKKTMLTSKTYDINVNKYGKKCGGSLGMWESSGWISDVDPYGWFQWYCRFFRGRRCEDDVRQISRWNKSAGTKGRFRSQLANKCLKAEVDATDMSISPVIRQTLLHWGFELTPELLDEHADRMLSK